MKHNLATFKYGAPLLASYATFWATEPFISPRPYVPGDFLTNHTWARLPFLLIVFFGLLCDYKQLKKQRQSR
jgi:hypothetical protein